MWLEKPPASSFSSVELLPYIPSRLFVVGSGALPVAGSIDGVIGLDETGGTTLVVTFASLTSRGVADLADQLARLAALDTAGFRGAATNVEPEERIQLAHARFFQLSQPVERLNHSQQVVIVVHRDPAPEVWRALGRELFGHLAGIYKADEDGRLTALAPAEATVAPAGASTPRMALTTWVALASVLLGVTITGVALFSALNQPEAPETPATPVVQAPIRDVVGGVPAGATSNQGIGQHRVVRLADGRLLALFPGSTGLNLVTDQANQGRSWAAPVVISNLTATSVAAAADSAGGVHIAHSDGIAVWYLRLRETKSGWKPSAPQVVGRSSSPIVSVAWDRKTSSSQLAWVQESRRGQAPVWTSIRADGEIGATFELAAPADDVPVLVNVAARDGRVVATYRRGDSAEGWFARAASVTEAGRAAWGREEPLPTRSLIAGGTLGLDATGAAHLVLVDGSAEQLTYFRRTDDAGWADPEVVVAATELGHIQLPALSLDESSQLIYLFFQSNETVPASEVRMAVRDPATGWDGPYGLAAVEQIPFGAAYPTAPATTTGQPVVLWTTGAAPPSVQAARVSAP